MNRPQAALSVMFYLSFVVIGDAAFAAGFWDRVLTDYFPLKTLYDRDSGKYVELGVYRNFSSALVEVTLFDNGPEKRHRFEKRITLFQASDVPEDVRFDYVDRCYVVRYNFFRADVRVFVPQWVDLESGAKICLRLISNDGTKYLAEPIGSE